MTDMKDKVALITGASSGIGRATAEAFAVAGASVVLAARREDELAALSNEIESKGGKASFVTTDVSAAHDVEHMVAHTIETFGRLDYAVNNAGIEGQFSSVVDLLEEEWDRVLDINLKGIFLCLKYEARAMLAGGHGGAIVNVGSINSFLGFPSGVSLRRVEAWTDRSDDKRFRGACATGNQGEHRLPGHYRDADASAGSRAPRRRDIRQRAAATCSYQTRGTPRGDRPFDCLSLL